MKVIFIFFSQILIISSVDLPKPAYFDIQLDRFEQLQNDPSVVDASEIKVRKVNKTRSIIGNMKTFVEIGNDILVQGKAYKKQGNEYRLSPYKLQPQPLCDTVINDSKFC